MVKTSTPTDMPDTTAALQSIPHTDDVVEYMLRCVLALAPSLNQAVIDTADRHMREVWGGDRPYIARRAGDGLSTRNAAIRRDHQAGERIPLLVRRYGLTARQISRIVHGG